MDDTLQGYADYLKEITRHIAWPVTAGDYTVSDGQDLVPNPYTPLAIPVYADTLGYSKWMIVNGFASDISPYKYNPEPWKYPLNTTDITIYGLFLTDPDPEGLGENLYVPFSSLQDYLRPLSSIDSYNGKYIMVADPPAAETGTGASAPE
jgi:hypothetical protein